MSLLIQIYETTAFNGINEKHKCVDCKWKAVKELNPTNNKYDNYGLQTFINNGDYGNLLSRMPANRLPIQVSGIHHVEIDLVQDGEKLETPQEAAPNSW